MTTKTSGGRMTGLIALTLEAQAALAVGDPVHVTGNYECNKADGTKPVVGFVSSANKRRGTFGEGNPGVFPVAAVPGDVTVEAIGFGVQELTAGTGGVTAGSYVAVAAAGAIKADGASTARIGIALTTATAGNKFDCLVQSGIVTGP